MLGSPPPSAPKPGLPWGPIIAGAATLGGAYLGYKGQKETNAANAQQARDAMAFEERMSNTSFQRGRADLEAAGYNPALAYNKGGADTPGGKTANMENALAGFGGSAESAVRTFNSIQETRAQIAKTAADTRLTQAQANQLNLESADRATDIRNKAALSGTDATYASKTLPDRTDMVNSQRHIASNAAGESTINLERNLRGWERDRDVLWPLAVEQLRQDLKLSTANTRDVEASAHLRELDIPSAENMARMAKTTWGRNISPYLSDASKIANALSIGAGGLGLARFGKNLGTKTAPDIPKLKPKTAPYAVDWDNILSTPPRRYRK